MIKIKVVLVLLAIWISGCSLATNSSSNREQAAELGNIISSVEDRQQIQLQVGSENLTVEVVSSPESITKGLGERNEIGSDGMLFLLPERRIATFWMKGMVFPLDMVWIDGDSIIGITENVPVITDAENWPTYSSPSEVTYVLELPAGDAQRRQISVGDRVSVTSK